MAGVPGQAAAFCGCCEMVGPNPAARRAMRLAGRLLAVARNAPPARSDSGAGPAASASHGARARPLPARPPAAADQAEPFHWAMRSVSGTLLALRNDPAAKRRAAAGPGPSRSATARARTSPLTPEDRADHDAPFQRAILVVPGTLPMERKDPPAMRA